MNTLAGKLRKKTGADRKEEMIKRKFFEEEILPHYKCLYYHCLKILKNRAAAEDAVQLTMERAWGRLHTLKDPEKARSWLFSIARNQINTQLKRKKKRMKYELSDEFVPENEMIAVHQDVLSILVREEERSYVGQAVAQLPEKYRDLIELRYYWNFSEKDIAKITGLRYGTVRVYIHRSLKMLLDTYNELARKGS